MRKENSGNESGGKEERLTDGKMVIEIKWPLGKLSSCEDCKKKKKKNERS